LLNKLTSKRIFELSINDKRLDFSVIAWVVQGIFGSALLFENTYFVCRFSKKNEAFSNKKINEPLNLLVRSIINNKTKVYFLSNFGLLSLNSKVSSMSEVQVG